MKIEKIYMMKTPSYMFSYKYVLCLGLNRLFVGSSGYNYWFTNNRTTLNIGKG